MTATFFFGINFLFNFFISTLTLMHCKVNFVIDT